MNNDELWRAVLGELELVVSKASFTTWFKDTFISEHANSAIIINVPNAFTKEWFEKRYHDTIVKTITSISDGEITQVTYKIGSLESVTPVNTPTNTVIQQPTVAAPTQTEQPNGPIPTGPTSHGLNPKYVFDTFIVGKSNELAHAASRAVAEKPGTAYNPLFIYGGVGLGKTHLMQAIGHDIAKREINRKILYTTCESFTNDFVQAIKSGQTARFQSHYRNIDLLLIDDIQFMEGKEQTQEQFFHTFNSLHQSDKQIIVTSDRPPKALPGLESRLQSRFEWGMIADVGQPDLETRIAILEAKLSEKEYSLDKPTVEYVASQIQDNIRELEGVVNHIMALHQLRNQTPSLEDIKEVIGNLTSQTSRGSLTPSMFVSTIAEFFDISTEDLLGSSRKKHLVFPRQITMYLMREELKSSFPSIGQEMGGKDHTTAIHAYEKIKKELDSSEKLRQDVTLIKNILYKNT